MNTPDVAIREAEVVDMPALLRLAELDSRPVPAGKLLVAEVDGGIRAALAADSGVVIADPFVRTAELEALLRLRADQVTRAGRARGRLLRAVAPRRVRVARAARR